MRMYDVIEKKRDGYILSKEEIDYFIKGLVDKSIPDYQISALLMAIFLNGMTFDETLNLTLAMRDSGDKACLSGIEGVKVDKHSTGGVGDKTSLVLGPMVAALGVKVAKMSGRGLGHTGGTIDKLESFSGFKTALEEDEFIKQINDIGIAITGQTGNLAPADKKLYALRDVTATVNNISLIASSIMSKKLASGADAIVLDVKTGSGAFMKSEEEAYKLALDMVKIGKGAGKKTLALITDMDQPLGNAVGNALEVIESIKTLKGEGPEDLTNLCIELGARMVMFAYPEITYENAVIQLNNVLKDGSALKVLADLVKAQGGNDEEVYNEDLIAVADLKLPVFLDLKGYVKHIDCEHIGTASRILGGGREKKEDNIDLRVGVIINKKVCDYVNADEPVAYVYANDKKKADEAISIIKKAYELSDIKPDKPKLIKRIVE